jgi:maleate isomerase
MARPKRIGVLVPAGNQVVEPDYYSVAPKGVTIHASRMPTYSHPEGGGDGSNLSKMNEDLEHAAGYLRDADLDLIVYACTSGTYHKGSWEYDRQIAKRMEQASGLPGITAFQASVEALRKVGAQRISVAGPYGDKLLTVLKALLEEMGFTVISYEGEPEMKRRTRGSVIGNQDPKVILEFVPKAIRPEADTVFLPGTAWRALEVADELERITGKTVVTVNQASIWMALRRLEVTDSIPGFGRLLKMPL